jgi:hypothetical protein
MPSERKRIAMMPIEKQLSTAGMTGGKPPQLNPDESGIDLICPKCMTVLGSLKPDDQLLGPNTNLVLECKRCWIQYGPPI